MGAAAYNRGSRVISREANERMPTALARADRDARKEEAARLRAQVERLERDLARARRCIAELRRSKAERLSEVRAELSRSERATSILCHIAFPGDAQ